jgi:hypothetical protein
MANLAAIPTIPTPPFARGEPTLPSSINGMRVAGIMLAVAICCGGTKASAQLRVFVGPSAGGPGFGNTAPAPGSAGLGTAGLGLGGFGSATENMGLGDTGTRSSPGLSLPLLNQGAGNALGVTGNAAGTVGTAQGSLSSAIDRPSSPLNSVTNSLMGPVSNAVSAATHPATSPAGKRKQNGNAGATSSSDRGPAMAAKVSPAKSP